VFKECTSEVLYKELEYIDGLHLAHDTAKINCFESMQSITLPSYVPMMYCSTLHFNKVMLFKLSTFFKAANLEL
jgi:hypothetical protein